MLLAIRGDSPNDAQHPAHETWNFALRERIGAREMGRALDKILADQTALGEAWLSRLTRRQRRVLLATAFHEHLGYATERFLAAAGESRGASIVTALRPCVHGKAPIVEKLGSRFRVRGTRATADFPASMCRTRWTRRDRMRDALRDVKATGICLDRHRARP